MKILAFIPARGGSKGIPGKNLVPLLGKPMLQYTIEAAKASTLIDEVFLSSDDERIIACGRTHGLDSGYSRPVDIAGDRAPMIDAVLHGLDWLEDRGDTFQVLVLLQPTSPLRASVDIDGAIRRFIELGTNTLVSVHRMTEHPSECVCATAEGWRWLEKPAVGVVGRQDYGKGYFFVNGAVYVARVDFLRSHRTFIEEGKTALFEIPSARGVDVDERAQLSLAEHLLTLQHRQL